MLTVLDLSHWNPAPDFRAAAEAGAAAAAGAAGAILKASQGKGNRDPDFVERWPQVVAAGMVPGAYHFSNFSAVPAKEANNFLAQIYRVWQPGEPGLFALDLEWAADGSVPDDLEAAFHGAAELIRIVEHDLKRPLLLYTAASFWAQCGNPQGVFQQRPLWVAHHGKSLNAPAMPMGWSRWLLWQHAGHPKVPGSWPGMPGNVDLNRFAGTAGELAALAGGGWRPPIAADPPPPAVDLASRALVRKLQTALNQHGGALAVDGLMGPKTRTALRDLAGA